MTRLRGLGDTVRRNRPVAVAYVVVLVLFAIGTIKASGFASGSNIETLLMTASFIGFVGLGQTLCILTGGIDLSVPSVIAAGAMLTAKYAEGHGDRLPLLLVVLVLLAALVGLINGVGVAYAGVPPIIMTLGMGGAVLGLVLVVNHGGFAPSPPPGLLTFVRGEVAGVPTLVVVWLVVALVGTFVLSRTVFGRRLYAVGTNARSAYLAGVNVPRTLVVPYVVSAVGAVLTGVLLLGYRGQAFNNIGDEYLFSSAVAVAVGGASILGGRGTYAGTVAGALILVLVTALLPLFHLGSAAVQVSYGVTLIIAVFAANSGGRQSA